MTLRDATPEDLPTIAELIRQLAAYERAEDQVTFDEEELGRALFAERGPAHITLACTASGEVAGMALWFMTFSSWVGRSGIWLEDLFVRPEHRGAGHGRALMEDLRARTTGRVEWTVLDWNAPAIDFYRGLGARPVEGWTRYRWAPA